MVLLEVHEKRIVFNFQFELISLASKDVFIKLLPNIYVIKTFRKSNKIVMWIVWNLYNVTSAICQFSTLGKHLTFITFCLNYPNQLSVPKNSSGNVKKSMLKHENTSFLRFLHINNFLWKLWFEFHVQWR